MLGFNLNINILSYVILYILNLIILKERERSVFYEGDGFMLGFNPYLAPGENQVLVFLGACMKCMESILEYVMISTYFKSWIYV